MRTLIRRYEKYLLTVIIALLLLNIISPAQTVLAKPHKGPKLKVKIVDITSDADGIYVTLKFKYKNYVHYEAIEIYDFPPILSYDVDYENKVVNVYILAKLSGDFIKVCEFELAGWTVIIWVDPPTGHTEGPIGNE